MSGDYGTSQIVLLRVLLALPLVLLFAHWQQGIWSTLKTQHPGWQLYRGILTAGANFGFFYGLAFLPLVTAVLLAYISPLLIVLLSWPLLGERVGWQRAIGVVIGFAGTLCIVQPDSWVIHPAMLAVLGSSLCWALLAISNRRLADTESAATLSFYTLPVSGIAAAFLTVGHWTTPTAFDWGLFAIAGAAGAATHFLTASAARYAKASSIAPLEYTNLIWVALAAFLFWREVPDSWTLIGGLAIIVGGFIATQVREL